MISLDYPIESLYKTSMIKILSLVILSLNSYSQLLKATSQSFYESFNGRTNFLQMSTSGSQNRIIKGTAEAFKPALAKEFLKIYSNQSSDLQWQLRNLTENKIIDQTKKTQKLFYGASITKIFVAAAFLKHQSDININQFQLLNDLIVKSSNRAWSELQILIGSGSENRGRQKVQEYLNTLGIFKSIGFRGYLGEQHGNEVNVEDLGRFIQYLYDNERTQEYDLMKLMFLSRTGSLRLKKYLSSDILVAGKTGTFNGKTVVSGKNKTVVSKHHLIIFTVNKITYSLTVLSDHKKNEDLAILAKGLILLKIKSPL